jgi:hypothetical protein
VALLEGLKLEHQNDIGPELVAFLKMQMGLQKNFYQMNLEEAMLQDQLEKESMQF